MKTGVLGKPDSKGRYTRDLGFKLNGSGQSVQHRFLLGKDRAAAEARYDRLTEVWEGVKARWHRKPGPGPFGPVWDALTLKIGQAVAKGEEVVTYSPEDLSPFIREEEVDRRSRNFIPDQANIAGVKVDGMADAIVFHHKREKAMQVFLMDLQRDFPCVRFSLDKNECEKVVDAWVGEQVGQARTATEALTTALTPVKPTTTLFEALDAWAKTQVEKYTTSEHGKKQADRVVFLKRHIKDVPLTLFDMASIESVRDKLRNRPETLRGKPASIHYTQSVVKALNAFIEWLAGKYGWRYPDGYRVKGLRLTRTPAENAKRYRKPRYTPEELVTLYANASPLERVYLLLALNCGFGAGELCTLQVEEIHFDEKHEEYGVQGSYIKRDRTKSGIYAEWRLWPETVQALRWYREHKNGKASGPLLLVKGKPIAFTKGGNRSQYFANRMKAILRRIAKDKPDFRALSFNKLRKTAATLIRKVGGANVAKEFIAHGTPADDTLLDLYTDRYFLEVFKAQAKVRKKYLLPMFAAVAEPFPADGKKSNPSLSLETRNKIKEMRAAGVPYKTICEQLHVSMDTVRRYSERTRPRKVKAEKA